MIENKNQQGGVEKSKTSEFAEIKKALVAFQDAVLSIQNPDQLTADEFERLGGVGDKLIENGWPLERVLDLYYGMRPDATKPELSTKAAAGLMIARDEEYKFNYWEREDDEDASEDKDFFQMPFGRRGFVDIDKLLPESGKRKPLP